MDLPSRQTRSVVDQFAPVRRKRTRRDEGKREMPTPIDTDRDEPLVVSVARAARLLGISKAMAYELAHRGELPTLRLGRRLVVPKTGIDKLVASALASPSPARCTQMRKAALTNN